MLSFPIEAQPQPPSTKQLAFHIYTKKDRAGVKSCARRVPCCAPNQKTTATAPVDAQNPIGELCASTSTVSPQIP